VRVRSWGMTAVTTGIGQAAFWSNNAQTGSWLPYSLSVSELPTNQDLTWHWKAECSQAE